MARDRRLVWLLGAVLAAASPAACGPVPIEAPEGAATTPARIITTERGGRGGRLVILGEDGARLSDITELTRDPRIDSAPILSEDGRFVAFTSTRERADLGHTSIWLTRPVRGTEARRLTRADAVDRDPRFAGGDLIFASNRGGSFDLWRLPLEPSADGWPSPAGAPVRLTDAPTQELSPSLSPDGQTLVYMVIADDGGSTLWTLPLASGTPTRLSDGPIDLTPAWGPGGRIAFAAPTPDGDADLYLLDPATGARELVVREELADQTGPAWSADGRYLFATAVFRSAVDERALLSSVVYVDLRESPRVVRALHDPAVVESRLGVALGRQRLDEATLGRNEAYASALRRVFRQEGLRREAGGEPGEP